MTDARGLLSRWATFTRERYEPITHLAMAAAFALGNAGVAAAGAVGGVTRPSAVELIASVVLVVIFFFRLRVFDEIKDYDVDQRSNPQRPLARGLISLPEARRAVWVLAAAELAIVMVAGRVAGIAWAVAFVYSLAMYREFGIGEWLSPRMELYAISHTLVASGLGLCVASLVLGAPLWELPGTVWLFAATNWALFNIFEFSRKTFSLSEERPGVESYSSRWGSLGAVALTLAWVGLGLASAAWAELLLIPGLSTFQSIVSFGVLALLLVLPYTVRPQVTPARWLRATMSGWAAAFYVMVGIANLRGIG